MKSLSALEVGLQQQPGICRQRSVTQRPSLYRKQRLICAAQNGNSDKAKLPCGAVLSSTVLHPYPRTLLEV